MIKVIYFTNHAAPYNDRLRDVLHDISLSYIYYEKKNKEKVWNSPFGDNRTDLFLTLRNVNRIFRVLASSELVIIAGWNNPLRFLMIFIFSKISGCRVFGFSDHPLVKKRNFLNNLYKSFIFSVFDGLLCATHSTKSYYRSHFNIPWSKLIYFPYCSNFNEVVPMRSTNSVVKILIANRFIERKGYSLIMPYIRQLILEFGAKVHIDILGNGHLMNEYSIFKASNVLFHGWTEHSDYLHYLKGADIFIHASEDEPFGIPPVDAFAAGARIIVSDGVQSFSIAEVDWRESGVYKFSAIDGVDFFNKVNFCMDNLHLISDRSDVFNRHFGVNAFDEFKDFINVSS